LGGEDSKAHAKVSWNKICTPKRGGLGIKNHEAWNIASMLNQIWTLFTKAGSLWVAWIKIKWLKGKSLRQVSIPKDCSWSWKKLLKLRNDAKKFMSFKIGMVLVFFFFLHDMWHPTGCLLDCYGPRAVHDLGLQLDAKLSTIIKGGDWYWPFARSNSIVEIQCKLSEIPLGGADLLIWLSPNGVYSCVVTWDHLGVKQPNIVW
jgi:hypothetical protein